MVWMPSYIRGSRKSYCIARTMSNYMNQTRLDQTHHAYTLLVMLVWLEANSTDMNAKANTVDKVIKQQ